MYTLSGIIKLMKSKLILDRIDLIEQELQKLRLEVETELLDSDDEATDNAQNQDGGHTFADLRGAFPQFAGLSLEEIKKHEYKSKLDQDINF